MEEELNYLSEKIEGLNTVIVYEKRQGRRNVVALINKELDLLNNILNALKKVEAGSLK